MIEGIGGGTIHYLDYNPNSVPYPPFDFFLVRRTWSPAGLSMSPIWGTTVSWGGGIECGGLSTVGIRCENDHFDPLLFNYVLYLIKFNKI